MGIGFTSVQAREHVLGDENVSCCSSLSYSGVTSADPTPLGAKSLCFRAPRDPAAVIVAHPLLLPSDFVEMESTKPDSLRNQKMLRKYKVQTLQFSPGCGSEDALLQERGHAPAKSHRF